MGTAGANKLSQGARARAAHTLRLCTSASQAKEEVGLQGLKLALWGGLSASLRMETPQVVMCRLQPGVNKSQGLPVAPPPPLPVTAHPLGQDWRVVARSLNDKITSLPSI